MGKFKIIFFNYSFINLIFIIIKEICLLSHDINIIESNDTMSHFHIVIDKLDRL